MKENITITADQLQKYNEYVEGLALDIKKIERESREFQHNVRNTLAELENTVKTFSTNLAATQQAQLFFVETLSHFKKMADSTTIIADEKVKTAFDFAEDIKIEVDCRVDEMDIPRIIEDYLYEICHNAKQKLKSVKQVCKLTNQGDKK